MDVAEQSKHCVKLSLQASTSKMSPARSSSRTKRTRPHPTYVLAPPSLAVLGLKPYKTTPFEEGVRMFFAILALAAVVYFIGWATYGFSQMMVESFKWLSGFTASQLLHYAALGTGALLCYIIPVIFFCPQILG